jgi:hypothetical protein
MTLNFIIPTYCPSTSTTRCIGVRNTDILTAVINTFATLSKMRPSLRDVLVPAMMHWEPIRNPGLEAILNNPLSTATALLKIKSVDKTAWVFLNYVYR